jgi:hypothetical protein
VGIQPVLESSTMPSIVIGKSSTMPCCPCSAG